MLLVGHHQGTNESGIISFQFSISLGNLVTVVFRSSLEADIAPKLTGQAFGCL